MFRRLGWAMLPSRIQLNFASRSRRVNQAFIQDNWIAQGEPNYSGHTDIDYVATFERQPYVFAAITAVADDIAALPVQLKFNNEVIPRDRWPSMFDVFKNANLDDSFADLTRALVIDQILMGEFFALIEDGKLFWVPAWRTRPIPDKIKRIGGFITEVNGQKTVYRRDDMIYLPDHGPRHMVEGMSRLDPLTHTLKKDGKQVGYELSLWANNGRLAGLLKTDQQLTQDDINELDEQWHVKYGGTNATGKTAILHSGLDYTRIGVTAEESGYHQSRKENVDEILAVLGVPPTRVMRTDNVNYANSVSELGTYYRNTVRPRADRFFAALTRTLMRGTKWEIKADYSQIHYLVLERKDLFLMAQSAFTSGLFSLNESRELVGAQESDVDWADEPLKPQQMATAFSGEGYGLTPETPQLPAHDNTAPAPKADASTASAQTDDENQTDAPVVNSAIALSGTQIESLLQIINKVVLGKLPRASAVEIMKAAFNLQTEQADAMLGEVGKSFEPEVKDDGLRSAREALIDRSLRAKVLRHKAALKREYQIAREDLAVPILEAMAKANDQALLDDLRDRGKRAPNPHDPPKLPSADVFDEITNEKVNAYVIGAWSRVGQEELDTILADRSALSKLETRDSVTNISGSFDLQDPEVIAELAAREVQFKTLTEDLQGRVSELIVSGLERGLSINQIRQELNAFFVGLLDWQATRIARTESVIATNKAARTAMKQVGAKTKRWLHSGNPQGRIGHISNARQGDIPFDKLFSNGMDHPGDTRASADEIINCQCAMVATGF